MEDGQSVVKRHSPAAEEDPERHRASSPVHEKADVHEEEEKAPRRSKRVASLDVFRGLTVAVSWPATSDQTRH
jgi:heparan-alpha-glucosaminide N-acetyltransferase